MFYRLFLYLLLTLLLTIVPHSYSVMAFTHTLQAVNYPVPAEAYFVSPSGSGETCSESQPCASTTALKLAPRGMTIVFRGGIYHTGDIDINKNYTLQPYPNETPILDGSQVVSAWAVNGDDWVTDWQHTFPKSKGGESYQLDEAHSDMDMVWINNQFQTPVKTRAEVVLGTFFVDYGAKKVYIGTDPGGKTVELTRHRYGIQRVWWNLEGVPGEHDPEGLTIRGLTFRHYAQDGVWSRAKRTILENNTFTYNHLRGVITYESFSTLRGNEISHNWISGGHVSGSGVLFENNLVRDNNFGSTGEGAVKFGFMDNSIIRGNRVENNNGNGIWLDVGADNNSIVHNTVVNNTAAGIFYEISDNAIIAGNIVVGNQNGIRIFTSANGRVYNNTLVNNIDAFDVVEYYRDDADSNQGPGNAANTQIFNNIFFDVTSTDWPWALVTVRSALCGTHKLIKGMDHNAYHRTNIDQPIDVLRWDNTPGSGTQNQACNDQPQKTYRTLDLFRAEVDFEQHGIETSGADPYFVNAGSGNYQLKEGSPAIGAGRPLPVDVAVALGWQSGVAVDMGALQTNSQITDGPIDLLTNGGFEENNNGWTAKNATRDKRKCNKPEKIIARTGNCAYQFKGGAGENSKLEQRPPTASITDGDTITLSGYSRASGAVNAKVKVKVKYTDTSLATGKITANLIAATNYTALTGDVVETIAGEVASIKVTLQNKSVSGKVLLDDLSLQLSEGSTGLIPLP